MTAIDQLGLFGTQKTEKLSGVSAPSPNKLSLTIKFSNAPEEYRLEEALRRITYEMKQLDNAALVTGRPVSKGRSWIEQGFFAIDVETTGLDAASNRVIELAIVPFNMPDDVKPFSQLFSVNEVLSQEIVQITGISDDMLRNQPTFAEHADECARMLKRACFVVAYNAKFDRPFLESEMARLNKVLPEVPWVDPFVFICELDRFKRGKKLSDAAKRWGVSLENAHRAMADAQAAGRLMIKLAEKVDCHTLEEVMAKQKIWQWKNAHHMAELKRGNNWSINR